MGVSGLGLLCLGRDDLDLHQQGQVIGRDPRQRRAQDLGPRDIHHVADEHMVQAEHRQPGREGRPRPVEVAQSLGVPETLGDPPIGP